MQRAVVIHYGEIALKGGNRDFFEKWLIMNIRRATAEISSVTVKKTFGRFLLLYEDPDQEAKIKKALEYVFGIANFSFATIVEPKLDVIGQTLISLLQNRTLPATFAIDMKRTDKTLPFTSEEAEKFLGNLVRTTFPLSVSLKNPSLTCFIECVNQEAYVYIEKIPGLGGLPVGTSGKIVSLLSSGIDSPVASFLMMKRGCEVTFVHFHSYPQTSILSQENVKAIVKTLSHYQDISKLYLVPFLDLQKRIISCVDPSLALILYRRYMFRIAEKIAESEGAKALCTGENLGQVASQTLENIAAIDQAVRMPVFRPLLTNDKKETIELAKKISTYDISIQPYEDCCSLFVPQHPELKANPQKLEKLEKEHGFDAMIEPMLRHTEIIELSAFSAVPAGIQSRNGGLRRGAAEPVSKPLTIDRV